MDVLHQRSIPIESLENFCLQQEVKVTEDNLCIVFVYFIFILVFEQWTLIVD